VRVALASPPLLKRYFRVDEVVVYFAISARTVYCLLDEGDLQATRIRACVRVSSEEIRRFEETLTEEAPF
jgi:excisionase family DNA binding protein